MSAAMESILYKRNNYVVFALANIAEILLLFLLETVFTAENKLT